MRVALVIAIVATVFAMGLAFVFGSTGTVTISETISASMPDGVDVALEPNGSGSKTVVVTNSGSVATDVIVSAVVNSDVGGPLTDVAVTLDPPQPMSVPAGGSATATLTLVAGNGVAVQTGSVEYSVIRP